MTIYIFQTNIIETFLHFLGVLLKAERDSAHLLCAPAHPVLGASFHVWLPVCFSSKSQQRVRQGEIWMQHGASKVVLKGNWSYYELVSGFGFKTL